jgi:hypothetical protein
MSFELTDVNLGPIIPMTSRRAGKARKKSRTSSRPKNNVPSHALAAVKQLLLSVDGYRITQPAGLEAWRDFQWDKYDIVRSLNRLGRKDFKKTVPSTACPGVMIDVYVLRTDDGKCVYTHFYIDVEKGERKLIINSFHKAE